MHQPGPERSMSRWPDRIPYVPAPGVASRFVRSAYRSIRLVELEQHGRAVRREQHLRTTRAASVYSSASARHDAVAGMLVWVGDVDTDAHVYRERVSARRWTDDLDVRRVGSGERARKLRADAAGMYSSTYASDESDTSLSRQSRRVGSEPHVYGERVSTRGRVHHVELWPVVEPNGAPELLAIATRMYPRADASDDADSGVPGQSGWVGPDSDMYRKRMSTCRWPNDLVMQRVVPRNGTSELLGELRVGTV